MAHYWKDSIICAVQLLTFVLCYIIFFFSFNGNLIRRNHSIRERWLGRGHRDITRQSIRRAVHITVVAINRRRSIGIAYVSEWFEDER